MVSRIRRDASSINQLVQPNLNQSPNHHQLVANPQFSPQFTMNHQPNGQGQFHQMASSSLANQQQSLLGNHLVQNAAKYCLSFTRYQHNKDLVALVNAFADRARDLPPGWESKRDGNGKVSRRDN